MTDRPSLLIVDDDPLIADTLAYALGRDFEVLTSDSRLHAISLLRQLDQPPQLALVDLGLPPSPHRPDEGFALIQELLAHSPAMKILFCPGRTMPPMPDMRAPSVPRNLSPNLAIQTILRKSCFTHSSSELRNWRGQERPRRTMY